jgi:hypothetical protein
MSENTKKGADSLASRPVKERVVEISIAGATDGYSHWASQCPTREVWGRAETYVLLPSAMLDSTMQAQPELRVEVASEVASGR